MGHELHRARLCQQPHAGGNFNDIYEHSALRVRERGLDDFEFYTKHDRSGDAGEVVEERA